MPQLLHKAAVLVGNGEKQILHHHGMEKAGGGADGEHLFNVKENNAAVFNCNYVV